MLLMNMLSQFVYLDLRSSQYLAWNVLSRLLSYPPIIERVREDAMRDAKNDEIERFRSLLFQVANAYA